MIQRKKPIRKVSKKKAILNAIYSKLKKGYLQEHPWCEACKDYLASDIHHKKGQGIYQNEVKYFMSTCRLCHSKIEFNRAWAYDMGYLLDRLSHE